MTERNMRNRELEKLASKTSCRAQENEGKKHKTQATRYCVKKTENIRVVKRSSRSWKENEGNNDANLS